MKMILQLIDRRP